jgi:hypothetical protein
VVEERAVFGREYGVDQDLRHLIERDVHAVLLTVQARDRVAVVAVLGHIRRADERRLRLDALRRQFDLRQ